MTDNGKQPRHGWDCNYNTYSGLPLPPCNCGLAELLQQGELAEQLKEALAGLEQLKEKLAEAQRNYESQEQDIAYAGDEITTLKAMATGDLTGFNELMQALKDRDRVIAELEQDRERRKHD